MTEHKISVTLTSVGVNMGDHAQNIVNVLDVDPAMTIGRLVEAELTDPAPSWGANTTERVPKPDNYLTIRIARPLITPKPESGGF
ncbi:hypothetical protein [Glutamicibacter ardleyensis]|uniref:hypothetical protein n=1 Tax=Glutamicibacter ardleyensis TaxID=225894 RepID=UPI003FCF3512